MKNKNMKKILLLTGVLCLASVGGVSAYLTDYDKVSNEFTVISKDPKIKNTGINDAYAYLEVSIPMANVTAAADNGSRLEKRLQELFSFQSKNSWTKLSAQKVGNNQVYVFAYNKILKSQETTESLFDTVKFLNIIEGQLDGQQLEIPVRAYAIQASYTGGDASSIVEQARNAYQKYVNQNKNQPGKVTE